jgi:hypothetical protein
MEEADIVHQSAKYVCMYFRLEIRSIQGGDSSGYADVERFRMRCTGKQLRYMNL